MVNVRQHNPTLSVVLVVKNEETRIDDCLQSISGWADEIVIVDDMSSDKTVEIARKYTQKVFQRKMDVQGAHRNWAYAQATGDWILSLDADERLTEELKREIKEVIPTTPHTHFSIPFKTYIADYWIRWGGWYPAPKVKLFQRGKFRYEEVEVHAPVIVEGSCGHLKSDMVHYSYRGWEDFLHKTNRQTNLEALKWYKLSKKDPKRAQRKMNFPHALWRTFDRFIRQFFVKQGWRDGFVGFMIAYYSSLYQLISYAKYRTLRYINKETNHL